MQTMTTLPCIITSGCKRNIFNFHEPFYQRHPIPLPYPTPANTRKHHAYMVLANMSEECRIPCDLFKDMFMNPVSVSDGSVVTQFLFRTIFTPRILHCRFLLIDINYIHPTWVHSPVIHTGQEPRLQLAMARGLVSTSQLFLPPEHSTVRSILPFPHDTEHYKSGQRTFCYFPEGKQIDVKQLRKTPSKLSISNNPRAMFPLPPLPL